MKKEQEIRKDIKKLRTNKQFLAILILLFVSLLFWVIISLITSQTSEKISPELQQLAKPLTPVVDTTVFDSIESKKHYTDSELSSFTIFKVLLSRDGKTETVVPLEVTIEDLEPESTPAPQSTNTLLNQQFDETEEETATESTFLLQQESTPEPVVEEEETQTTPLFEIPAEEL